MKSIAEISRGLSRCPRCHRGANPDDSGRCPRCEKTTSPGKWAARTEASPVQPEELNGCKCQDCGKPAWVMLAKRKANLDLVALLGIAGVAALVPALTVRPGGELKDMVVLWAVCLLPWIVFLRRNPRTLLRTVIVICEHCGMLRVGGRKDGRQVRAFERGRMAVASARRMLIPAYCFLAVLSVYRWLTEGQVPRSTLALLGAVAIALIAVSALIRVCYPMPRRFWDVFLLRN